MQSTDGALSFGLPVVLMTCRQQYRASLNHIAARTDQTKKQGRKRQHTSHSQNKTKQNKQTNAKQRKQTNKTNRTANRQQPATNPQNAKRQPNNKAAEKQRDRQAEPTRTNRQANNKRAKQTNKTLHCCLSIWLATLMVAFGSSEVDENVIVSSC